VASSICRVVSFKLLAGNRANLAQSTLGSASSAVEAAYPRPGVEFLWLMQVPLTPIRFMYRAADLYGRKEAIISGARRYTYAQFAERAERLAAAVLSEGIQPGDRVAYLSFNNNQLLEGYYGVPLARAIVLPLNVRLAPIELAAIVNHAGARMLIFEDDFGPVVQHLRQACPTIERYISVDGASPLADTTYEDCLSRGRLERPDIFSFDENAIAELFYTSGSTGTPKGVMLSHRTLYLHAFSVASVLIHDDRVVDLHTIPLFHANGWGHPHAATMHGAKQVMVRRFEPTTVFRLTQQEKATVMCLVPTMANALVNAPEISNYDVSSMQQIGLGGAASSPELIARLERAFHCLVLTGYGLTETSPVVTWATDKGTVTIATDEERWRRHSMTGWAVPGCEARVVDLHMNDVARDMATIGEIVIRGDMVMDGYYNDPEATAAAMSGGWLHTGDMAVWDSESYIQIVDRKKDIIISGGENISSLEVEAAISAHPAVLECSVVSAPDDHWGEVPAAFVHLKPGQEMTADQLCAYLQGRIASFKMPRIIRFTDAPLPKTGTGKILKRELRETLWGGKEHRVQG
jgi:fatty-acyl-CoA synthase